MRALFGSDLDVFADAEEVAEFQRGLNALGEEHRRVLMVLIPRLIALQERGDSAEALQLIAKVRRIVTSGEAALH